LFTNTKHRKLLPFIRFQVNSKKKLYTLIVFSLLVAMMCRLIQLLILIYGVAYLMVHKKGYQETDTSIISSITLKVKVCVSIFKH